MNDLNKNLATVQSDSLANTDPAPESSETVVARAVRKTGTRALPIQLVGSVTKFTWTDPTLQIRTSNPLLNLIQVKTAAGSSNGTYNTATVSAKLAIDAANLTNLRNTISVGMTVQVTYNPDINISTSTNCTNFTYGVTSVNLTIIPIP
ncbi:MAG TPA: hypothetical protein VIV60_34005 [Polyangiaceae bacterium]